MAYDGTLKFDTSMDVSQFQQGANKLGEIVKGLSVFKLLEKGFQAVTNSIDTAVKRYDTLEKFPRVLEQMGYSAAQSSAATQKLADGVQGLPTTLDAVVSTAQRLTVLTGNLELSTATTLALNDAFLASGASSADAERGLTQYVQMLSKGKVDLESWRTLQETMGLGLQKVAESFGYAGESAQNDLYAALKDGDITFKEFNARLVELDQGVGGFAELAKTASAGIATAFTNMNSRIAAGVANVIKAIDTGLSQTKFKSIENVVSTTGTNIKNILTGVSGAFEFLAKHIEPLTVGVVAFGVAWKGLLLAGNISQLGSLSAALTAMYPKIATLTVATIANTKATLASVAAGAIWLGQKLAYPAVLASLVVAIGANAVATNLLTAAENGNILAKIAVSAATAVATAAMWAYNAALSANPIGLVVVAIALLVGAIIGLIAIFGKGSAEYEKQKDELKQLSQAQEEHKKKLDESKAAAEKAIATAQIQSDTNDDLVYSLRELIATNDDAGKNNEDIAKTVEELNQSVSDLGLSYDKTTGKLSAGINEVEKYVKAQGELSIIKAQEEEYNRLLDEQRDIKAKILTQEEKQKIYAQQFADKKISQGEYNKLIRESEKLLKDYGETEKTLAVDVQASYNVIDTTAKKSATEQVNAYNAINGARDANGLNLKQLAVAYDTTTERILADMKAQETSMEEWSAKQGALFTESGQSIQGVANQWGMTTEQVDGYMQEWGMNLDEFADHMEATHTKEGLSLDDLAAKWGMTRDQVKTAIDNMGGDMQEWSDRQDKAWEHVADTISEFTESATNGFSKMEQDTAISLDKFTSNMVANQTAIENWTTNMSTLMDLGVNKGIIEQLDKLGLEGAAQAQGFVDELTKLNGGVDVSLGNVNDTVKAKLDGIDKSFSSGLDAAENAASTKLRAKEYYDAGYASIDTISDGIEANSSVTDATEKVATDGGKEFVDSFLKATDKKAEYSKVGKYMVDGVLSGINQNESKLYDKMKSMSSKAVTATEKELGINSPSKVFEKKVGAWIPPGIALGVQKTMPKSMVDIQKSLNDGVTSLDTEKVFIQGDTIGAKLIDGIKKGVFGIDEVVQYLGVSMEEIQSSMENEGITLDMWVERHQKALQDLEKEVTDRTGKIVNGFKLLPTEFEMSAAQMLENMKQNKVRYAEWEKTIADITKQLGPMAAEEFAKLGMPATVAMKEILASADMMEQYKILFGTKISETTGQAINDFADPFFIGAPSKAMKDAAAQVEAENALPTVIAIQTGEAEQTLSQSSSSMSSAGERVGSSVASGMETGVGDLSGKLTSALETAKTEAQAVDFSEVGQAITTQIVGAITGGTSTVTESMDEVGTALVGALTSAKANAVNTVAEMMAAVNSAIITRTATIKLSVAAVGNGVTGVLSTMKTQAVTILTNMMNEMNSAIITRTPTLVNSAKAVSNGTLNAWQEMVRGAIKIVEEMMQGMYTAMDDNADRLYDKAEDIADKIADTMADALDVHSPSRVMIRLFTHVMEGIYEGMQGMEGALYRKAEDIADGITNALSISPELAIEGLAMIKQATRSVQVEVSAKAVQLKRAGSSGGDTNTYQTNLTQNITSPTPLSPSEMTRKAQDLLNKTKWQLP